ncbi:MAG: ATP-binding protein [Candidatus Omnitrophica bacterium]|nr:ATP-binding protein [Candidatus Omnitrophota bacterium]
MFQRYLQDAIVGDALESGKIAFVSGPRQVGKTTLVESLLARKNQSANYFTWDDEEFRKVWIRGAKELLNNREPDSIIAFDEIHKDRRWKSKLKGLYDLYRKKVRFIVTGSARLDFYRKSGDSLQGRYFPYRLHPFSVGEKNTVKPPPARDWDDHFGEAHQCRDLLEFGGFPEPFFQQDHNKLKRWQRLYRERLIREDLRDLQNVRDLRIVEDLALLLQDRVGSQLSYQSLREDLSSSFESVKRWVDLLEALFYCHRVRPYSKNIKRSLLKEPKAYLYDWSLVKDVGARLENMVAGHLLKSCQAWTDCAIGEFELFYVRDKQKREVDFLLTRDQKVFALIEVKSGQSRPTNALLHFQAVLKPQFCIQVVADENRERRTLLSHPGVSVISVRRFLGSLV